MKHLDIKSLPDGGMRLIEASAGTGKTYTITNVYLRILIERRLPVSAILVVTYTVAAEDLPDVKNAMRLMVAKLYEFREGWVERLPDAARNILGNNYIYNL